MAASHIRVEYIPQGKRVTVRFRIESDTELESLKRAFECLSNGTKSAVRLVCEELVSESSGVGEIELQLVESENSKMPWVRVDKATSGKLEISWRRDREGWAESLDLLSSLRPETHQYFNYSDTSDVRIEASFLEN